MMSAVIVPFPAVARPRELALIVDSLAGASPQEAHDRLVRHMTKIIRWHQRAQVSEAMSRRDLIALEAYVWSRLAGQGSSGGRFG